MTHPVEAEAWDWDESVEAKLAAHHISPIEVEQVFENRPAWVKNKKHRAGDWKMVGTTHGGRALTIVLRFDSTRRLLRPITGWESTAGEVSQYGG